jgi:hypothetical protein
MFHLNSNKNKKVYFNVTKKYVAPKSKIKIIVNAVGFVAENLDLGYGSASVKLFHFYNKSDTVYLLTSPENIDYISYKNIKKAFNCNPIEKEKLYDYLVENNFKNLDKNEISELRDAMTYINYGAKTTYSKGQTKFIELEE